MSGDATEKLKPPARRADAGAHRMRPLRVGLAVTILHLGLAMIGAIIMVGAAFGAQRPWANTAGERAILMLTAVLLAPLTLLNLLLPRHLAPGYPVAGVVLSSVFWGAIAFAIAYWRQRRRAAPSPPDT